MKIEDPHSIYTMSPSDTRVKQDLLEIYDEESKQATKAKNVAEPERMQWKRGLEFLLSLIGYGVGLGNIWRFPYLCAKNGGAVFLIPYAIFMLVVAFPLSFLELSLGQFSGKSAFDVWDLCPALRGTGVAMSCIAGMCCLYYNTVLSWILYYLVHSFMSPLPWTTCNNTWNTEYCVVNTNSSILRDIGNVSVTSNFTNKVFTSTEEFWSNNLLKVSSGVDDLGTMQWHLVVALVFAWLIIFLCIVKGVKSVGKVVYVTATAPYIIILIILVRAVTLPGAARGIQFYLIPDFSKLIDIQMWIEALLQLFFSIGMGFGSFITMASYNKFNNNVLRDTVIYCLVGEGTSFFAGFVVFSVLGFMSSETGLSIADIVRTGPGLVFITYPEALSQLPLPQLWAVLFFLMLMLVGLDTMFVNVEVCVTAIVDLLPNTKQQRLLVTTLTCLFMFLITLIYASQAGIYIFQLVDWYFASVSLMAVTIVECIVVSWFYGADRYFQDIEMMLNKKPYRIFKILWRFVVPALLVIILVFTLVQYKPPTYGAYIFPKYIEYIGWTIALITTIPIPIWIVKEIISRKGPLKQRIKESFQPNKKWGPCRSYKPANLQAESLTNQAML